MLVRGKFPVKVNGMVRHELKLHVVSGRQGQGSSRVNLRGENSLNIVACQILTLDARVGKI